MCLTCSVIPLHKQAATKLLCYTQSSSAIRELPATFPMSHESLSTSCKDESAITRLIHANPNEILLFKLSALRTQVSVQEVLKLFTQPEISKVHSKENSHPASGERPDAKVLIFIANMQETSLRVINHLRILIDQSERLHYQNKLYVILLHFPPFSEWMVSLLLRHNWKA